MTLFKQLSILITFLLSVIFTIVLTIEFKNSADGVKEQLYNDAKNTSTSLSLSLASANGSISMMSTMINANFDNGAYESISLVDMSGNLLYERHSEIKENNVPDWFKNLVPIKAPVASANVSAGWNPIGILNVQSDASQAYANLYSILKSLFFSFSIIFVVSIAVLYMLLHMLLKPPQAIRKQAESIIDNKFIIQNKLSYTKEFHNASLAMNNMVKKVEDIFKNANEALKKQSELLYKDEHTGLYNRKYLINKLPEYLKIDAEITTGVCIMISLNGVQEANRVIGRQRVDKLYQDIASVMKQQAKDFQDSIAVRMNGTEFFLLLPECSGENGVYLAEFMDHASDILLGKELDHAEVYLTFGVYEYNHKQSVSQLLSASDYALAQSKLHIDKTHVYFHKNDADEEIMGKEEWRTILNFASLHHSIHFDAYNVADMEHNTLLHKVLSFSILSEEGQKYSYGKFIAPAITLGLDTTLYKSALFKLFKEPNHELRGSVCSLRLSHRFLNDPNSHVELQKLLEQYSAQMTFRLIIELPDRLVREESADIERYMELFEKYGIHIGIFEFIGESGDFNYLKELHPAYIKAESNYFLEQSIQNVASLQVAANSLGISLIATGVMDEDTLQELKKLGITKVQGAVTDTVKGL